MQDTILSKPIYLTITQHANYNNTFHAFIEADSFTIS